MSDPSADMIAADIIDILNVDFAYRDALVLKQVSLRVAAGSTLGLIGPNGGGKTTLIRLLLGLLEPTRGTIRIAGLAPRDAVARGDIIGYLPQNPTPPETRQPVNVRQVARLGLVGKTGMLRGYRRDDLAFVDELLEMIGIAGLGDAPIGTVSGGQFQRVLIARALAARPKVLLLDEPTTGIDRLGQQQFLESITALKQRLGLTVVFVSHDLRAVSAISDRIACLNLTLHYHDVPEHLPADLVFRMFSCDLEAFGLGGSCGNPEHQHTHVKPAETMTPVGATPASPSFPTRGTGDAGIAPTDNRDA
jgi:zinc transport system ATP-binding protein